MIVKMEFCSLAHQKKFTFLIYFLAAALGEMRSNHDPRVTFEGDNTVLLQQTTNWLLRQESEADDFSFFPLTCVRYLADADKILTRKFTGTKLDDVISHECKFLYFYKL
jgi:acyl-CoA oxidase